MCPTRYRTRHFFNTFTTNEDIATKFETDLPHTTDTFLFISHTTNVLLFKFRCDIFIGVRIIKEMPGSVTSGTHGITTYFYSRLYTGWRTGTGHWREHVKHPLSSDFCATLYFTVLHLALLSVFCLFRKFIWEFCEQFRQDIILRR